MLRSLHEKGYNPLAFRVPSFKELLFMIKLAGPVLLTMLSKVSHMDYSYDVFQSHEDYIRYSILELLPCVCTITYT